MFNLQNDPLELDNIYDKGQSIENELKEELLNWINR